MDRQNRGRVIYNSRCYFCHGYSGDAKTVAAGFLAPPPRDFTSGEDLRRDRMIASVLNGRANTAMRPFRDLLSTNDIAAVVDFIRESFIRCHDNGTLYHIAANGWPAHRERYGAAYPFVLGAQSANLEKTQAADAPPGLTLFRESCTICHDPVAIEATRNYKASRAPTARFSARWEIPVKPRRQPATPNAPENDHSEAYETYDTAKQTKHDIPPALSDLTGLEATGKLLYQKVCAYCHAADGSGKNWIGSFLEPHPPNFNALSRNKEYSNDELRQSILDGVPSTSMPAFRSALGDKDVDAIIAYLRRAFMRGQVGHTRPDTSR